MPTPLSDRLPPLPVFIAISLVSALMIGLSRLVSATGDVSLVWPPLGIAIGLMLVRGKYWVLPVLTGLVIWALTTSQDPRLLPIALAETTTGALLGTYTYRRLWVRKEGALADMLRLHAAGLLAGAASSALVGAAGFYALGIYPDMGFWEVFFAFWVTESMGALLFAPLVRALARDGIHPWRTDAVLAIRWIMLLAITLLLALLIGPDMRDIIALLAGLLIAWPAMRAQPSLLHALVLVLTASLLTLGLAGHETATNRVVLEQVLRMAALALLAQLLNAVAFERTQMLARERDAGRRDLLTGLWNERALREHLHTTQGALLMLRLEGFTGITDLIGVNAADDIERTIAQELRIFAEQNGIAARLGSGRYAFLMPSADAAHARQQAQTIYSLLDNRAFRGEHDVIALRPSLGGIATAGLPPENILAGARQALAIAAAATGVRIEFSSDSHALLAAQQELVRRQEEVKRALLEQRFVLYAQPITPLTAHAHGVHCEVLLRLQDTDGQIHSPAHFMYAAESAQLTGAIDRYVIEHLLAWLSRNPHAAARLRKCAINLTGKSVSDPAFAPWIREMVDTYRIDPRKLCFEITESQTITHKEHAHQLIMQLRAIGSSVSLDDFGTGLATFDYLKSFPFDYLKIDGSFVKALPHSPVDQAIVQSITQVARTMGLATIAEFVENEEIIQILREFNVDYGQGYALGKPCPLHQLLSSTDNSAAP